MPTDTGKILENLKSFIARAEKIVVFTGAGVSTECGISDYRSQGGLWQRYQPVTLQEFITDEDKRAEYWRRKKEVYPTMRDAIPGPSLRAIGRLENTGKLTGIITQNIDGLHRKAGNKNIIELHGTNLEVCCLHCEKTGPFSPVYERLLQGDPAPLCLDCGGLLKSNTISFGQMLDTRSIQTAFMWARNCDLLLCAGSSLLVEPAASIPLAAKQAGANLVILNREPTQLDSYADILVHSELGSILEAIIP